MREMTKRYFPEMPPMLDGETAEQYTDRLTGADGTARVPYDHRRYRQCSLGYHDECSDPAGDICECPCHRTALPAVQEVEKKERVYQGGTWNNWIAPFHLCAYCSESLNWEKTVDVLDRPWITAKCACGIIYSARLSADDLARARAVDDGNKLAASILSGLAPTPPAVTAEVDEDDLCEDCLTQKATEFFDAGGANQRCKDCTIKMLRQVCDRLQAEKQTPLDDPQAKGRIAVILRDYANEQPLEVAQRILAALTAPQDATPSGGGTNG